MEDVGHYGQTFHESLCSCLFQHGHWPNIVMELSAKNRPTQLIVLEIVETWITFDFWKMGIGEGLMGDKMSFIRFFLPTDIHRIHWILLDCNSFGFIPLHWVPFEDIRNRLLRGDFWEMGKGWWMSRWVSEGSFLPEGEKGQRKGTWEGW